VRPRGYAAQEGTKELPKVASGPAAGGNPRSDVWDWLRSCRTCDKPHEWRWTCEKTDHPNHHQVPFRTFCDGGTWASPDDGHPYRARLRNVDELQREYEETAT